MAGLRDRRPDSSSRSASPPPTRRLAGIDLLRGIAVGLVMLRHAFPGTFPGAGVVGVVMFFALSGYLITGVLHDELNRTGRIAFGHFYRRRVRRLVPALLFLVAGVALVTLLLDPLGDVSELPRTLLVALTWTANLPFDQGSDATFHLWTLATEEQFYLIWPAVLALAFARGRVAAALGVAAAGSLLACALTLVWLSDAPDLAYALPTSWAVCFVLGAAARICRDRPTCSLGAHPVAATWAPLLGLLALSLVPLRGHPLTYLVAGPVIAALTCVLLLAWRDRATVTGPALQALVWLGTVSYAAYLWNYPLTLWLRPHTDLAGPIALVATLVMAALSWRFVEQPTASRPGPGARSRPSGQGSGTSGRCAAAPPPGG